MDLRSTLAEQISDLITWMEDTADKDTPSAIQHQERCLELKERAWFLREICLPKIPTQKMVMTTIDINFPDRPDSLFRTNGFLRGKGLGTEALMGISSKASETLSEAAEPFLIPKG